MFAKYNIKPFAAQSNIHKAKTIRRDGLYHRHQRQYKPKGSDDDPPGSRLLDTIVFAAEFTNFSKLGCFSLYGSTHRCLSDSNRSYHALKLDKPVTGGSGCRSSPPFWFFTKKSKRRFEKESYQSGAVYRHQQPAGKTGKAYLCPFLFGHEKSCHCKG